MKYLKLYIVVLAALTIIGCSSETGNIKETQGNQIHQEESSSKEDTFQNESFIVETYNINTRNFSVAQPDIYEDTVVWAGGNNRDPKSLNRLGTIFLYEKNKKETQSLFETKRNGQTDETQINNSWICWVDWSDEKGSDWVIYAYSRQSQDTIQIASAKDSTRPKKGSSPRLSLSDNDHLSWIEEREVGKGEGI